MYKCATQQMIINEQTDRTIISEGNKKKDCGKISSCLLLNIILKKNQQEGTGV
jgi:hypothetical protein